MEVFAVSKAYIDGVKVAHCGVITCKKTRDVNGPGTWSFSLPDLDGSSKLQFQEEDVQKMFIYPEKVLVGFLLSSNMNRKSLIIEMPVYFPYDELEFNSFMMSSSKIFTDKSIFLTLHNQREAEKYITSNLPRGSDVWTGVFSIENNNVADIGDVNPEDSLIPIGFISVRPYYRGYTKFLMVNHQVKERESRSIIREIDDLSKFIKYYFGSPKLLQPLLFLFMMHHTCKNPGCKNFSYLKCQKCRHIYYCGKECQVQDWISHKEVCQHFKEVHVNWQIIPNLIQTEIQSIHGNELLTFEIFYKELSYKVFEVLHDSMKTSTFSFLFREDSYLWARDVSQLVKRRGVKSQTLNSFKEQFFKAFDEEWNCNHLVQMCLI